MSLTPARDFGVQSYCFRNIKDNATVAAKVKEIGLDKIEVCAIHADFDDLEGWKKIVEIYRNAGVSIVSIGVQTFTGADNERTWFECAKAAGAKHISAHFKVDSFHTAIPRVQEWCREFGIRVGVHCHGGYMFGGSQDVLDHLLALGGPEIGVWIDTAGCMQIGPNNGNPIAWAEKYAGKIYGVHYKDFVFEPNAKWKDVVVGTGTLDLPAFVAALEKSGFDGAAVIEYEGDPENPVPALKECVKSMRAAV
ncbi:MAG: sugar phosphate isomerase/epimerase family protein [Puniceicoccales bacterium]